ncbi:MAG: alpha/beta hydrolase [Myxococcota bacterium]|jgi:hypothetical protein|nr:alpha/beta hydrolase [Myxococcota bacterium]
MEKSLVIGAVIVVALIAVSLLALGCDMQRRILYPRPPVPPGEPRLPAGSDRVWLGEDEPTEAWFLRPPMQERRFPVVIFTHGNGELIDHWLPIYQEATRRGVGVLLVEYPGYGRSGGKPSQKSITRAMLQAYDFVADQPGVDRDAIVAHGRSLGGGAACALALERPLAAMVLESTFTSVRALAGQLGFPRFMVVDPFDNLAAVSELDIPILVIHGERDEIIPVGEGEALAAAAETELVLMSCGHNDCPFSWPIVEAFLAELGLLDR